MADNRVWYTRRNHEIRGPFPRHLILQYVLLGRIQATDEVSTNKVSWIPLAEVPELIPQVMQADLSDPLAQERLEAAKRWADERSAKDRRDDGDETGADHSADQDYRRGEERRAWELAQVVEHRATRTARLEQRGEQGRATPLRVDYIVALMAVLVISTMVIWLVVYYSPPAEDVSPDCGAEPGPGVDWSNCHLEGVQLQGQDLAGAKLHDVNMSGAILERSNLSGVDLSYSNLSAASLGNVDLSKANLFGASLRNSDLSNADLRGADLSYANLQGANLRQVMLEGAILDNTIWLDKSVCAEGSIGECLLTAEK